MAATVVSKKKYDYLLSSTSETIVSQDKRIEELKEETERNARTIQAQVREVSHWKEKAQRLEQRCEDLEVFRLRNSRKHWWEIWKPVYPY